MTTCTISYSQQVVRHFDLRLDEEQAFALLRILDLPDAKDTALAVTLRDLSRALMSLPPQAPSDER